jgi:hypothetical protein
MSQPILIKGTTSKATPITFAVLGAILFVVAIVFLFMLKLIPAVLLLFAGIVSCGVAALKFVLDVSRRVYLIDEGNGFTVRSRRGEEEYRDEDVWALGTECRQVFVNGLAASIRRQGRLLVGKEPHDAVEMDYTYPLNFPDPLAVLFDRLQAQLLGWFREELAAGRQVTGDGWSLDDKGLSVEQDHLERDYRHADLAAVSVVDRDVNIWERGVPEATIKMPLKSINAWALLVLLSERLPQSSDAREEVGDGLGRVIFQRDKSWSISGQVLGYLIGVLLTLGGFGCILAGLLRRDLTPALVGFGIIVGGAAIVAAAFFNRVNIFRAHTLGVARFTVTGTKEMRYDEVGIFTWQATRQFVNGAYTGTTMNLALAPLPGTDAQPIRFNTSLKGADDELDKLRDFIAAMMAGRWLLELQQGRHVPWTKNCTFHQDGLELGRRRGEAELIPYSTILKWNLDSGWLYLYGVANKPMVTEQCSQPNFFPGLMLLLRIINQGGVPRPTATAPVVHQQPPPIPRVSSASADDRERVRRAGGDQAD